MDIRNFISNIGILELGFQGPRFTWCNNMFGPPRISAILDRVFVNDYWFDVFRH